MKKILIAFFLAGIFFSCFSLVFSQEEPKAEPEKTVNYKYGIVSIDDIFIGSPDWKALMEEYQPKPESIIALASVAVPVKVEIYYGHWCPDSVNNVPKFLKTIELAANPAFELEFWSLEKIKKGEKRGPVNNRQLKAIPTFVVFIEGKEAGEIIENPTATIEEDLVNILSGNASGK